MPRIKELHVNGKQVPVDVDSERTLLSVLRDDIELTGAKYGCGEGECGACTVLLDGVAIRSCRAKVGNIAAKKITTVESLEQNGRLHPVQEAFLTHDAMQCGYCTTGMVMVGVSLLQKNPNPSEAEIIRGMDGNICRCGTYRRIIAAIQEASQNLRKA
ncbi:MAG: (2Fe-2S)-binding domain protein [Verrucomicrobiales bacterium]|nr:(2Fe-2S)-binding domain protein [Verrucomicrobiales bacterium]